MNTRDVRGHISRRIFLQAMGALGTLGLSLANTSWASTFPQRRVTLIVPFPVGTAVDVVARFLATKLTQQWNRPVYVENRAGGDGIIGTVEVKLAPMDGYTVLYSGPPFLFVPELNSSADYDPLRDFRPVARVTAPVYMLAATNGAPYDSFREMVALAKRIGSSLDVGTAGAHSTATVSGMAKAAGIEVNIINYKKTAQLISDAIAGHVPLVLSALGSLNALTRDGKLKPLVVSGPKRSMIAPAVPTAMEAGADGFSVVSWNGAFVRTGTPDVVVDIIAESIRKVTLGQDFMEFCRIQGLEPAFEEGNEWLKSLPAERDYLNGLLQQSGLAKKRAL